MSANRPRAALFDMDRTLVRRETASLYVRYQCVFRPIAIAQNAAWRSHKTRRRDHPLRGIAITLGGVMS